MPEPALGRALRPLQNGFLRRDPPVVPAQAAEVGASGGARKVVLDYEAHEGTVLSVAGEHLVQQQ